MSIERRGVEEPDPGCPRRLDDSLRLVIRDRFEKPAKWRSAEPESRDSQRCPPELDRCSWIQRLKIRARRSVLLPLKSCATSIIGAISCCQRMFTGSLASSAMARS